MNPNRPATPPGADAGARQAGLAADHADPSAAGVVATGDRHEEVHFERDPDQLVVARHLEVPRGPLPPQDGSADSAADAAADVPPIEDVRVAPQGPSVWDARPVTEDTDGGPSSER